jgi:hypothetical protein
MKALVWSSILAGIVCASTAGCSAQNTSTRVTGGGGTGSTSNDAGGTLSLGGKSPVGSAGTDPIGPLGGGDAVGGGGMAGACQTGGADFVPKVPTVMLLVDRSGTMFDQQGNPWNTLRDGVLPVVKDLNEQVRFGFISVTGEQQAGMCPLLDEVAPADQNYEAVAAKYMSLMRPTKGESPGMLGLSQAYDVLSKDMTPGDKYILFVTDGEQDYCGDGNHLCPTDSVVYWLQKLKALNVTTMVFGLPLSQSGDQLSYGAILQAFANAGAGQPVTAVLDNASQTPTSIWDQCNPGGDMNAAGWKAEFTAAAKVDDATTASIDESKTLGNYVPTGMGGTAKVFKPDPTDQMALAEQFRQVLAGVKSCSFDIGGDIKVIQTLLDEAHVYIEGVEVPLDPTATNGWHMPTETQIELVGEACTNWRMPEKNKITWDFPCKILVPVVVK